MYSSLGKEAILPGQSLGTARTSLAAEPSKQWGGVDQIAYSGVTPWHLQGDIITAGYSCAQAMQAHSMDWTVSKRQTALATPVVLDVVGPFTTYAEVAQALAQDPGQMVRTRKEGAYLYIDVLGQTVLDKSHAIVRDTDGVVLGQRIGERYEPLQNMALAEVVDSMGQGIQPEVLGTLYGGRQVWVLGKAGDTSEPITGDPLQPYILAVTSHDGSRATSLCATYIRVVCHNTLSYALNVSNGISVRHTANADKRLTEAAEYIARLNRAHVEMGDLAQRLASIRVNAEKVNRFVEAMVPIAEDASERTRLRRQARRNTLLDMYERDGCDRVRIANARGTGWGLFNLATAAQTHGVVGERNYGTPSYKEARLGSVLAGNTAQQQRQYVRQILAL